MERRPPTGPGRREDFSSSAVCFCCATAWLSLILLTWCACTRRGASHHERVYHRDMTVDATEEHRGTGRDCIAMQRHMHMHMCIASRAAR